MNVFYITLILICYQINEIASYEIPNPTLDKLPNGFSLSIPDTDGIATVAFNVNINRKFYAFEQGEISKRITAPNHGRWSVIVNKILSDDDAVYAWIHVQHKNSMYTRAPSKILATDGGTNKAEKDEDCDSQCLPSVTETSKIKGAKICVGDLIFEDDFNSDDLNPDVWTAETHFASLVNDAEFVLYHESNVNVKNGVLSLKASLWRDMFPNVSDRGALALNESCKSYRSENECSRQAQGQFVLPSVIAGRVNTKESFFFKYGRVEVRAKMPQGDWLFPLILLEPLVQVSNEPYYTGQIRVAYARGNEELNKAGKTNLFGGAVFTLNVSKRDRHMSATFSDLSDFHRYSLTWTNRSLIMQIDGREYGRVDSSILPRPLNHDSFIALGIAAGGHGDFPDHIPNKPWRNTSPKAIHEFGTNLANWHTTWKNPELQVDYIRIYAV